MGNLAVVPNDDEPQDDLQQQLSVYQERALKLIPSDDLTVRQCAAFIEECKLAEQRVEQKRKDLVDPLNTKVKEHNTVYMPVRDAFSALWRAVDQRVSRFLHEQRIKAEQEQRRLIQEANRKKAEEEAKAEEARKAAEAARTAGDEKLAAKMDAKADKADVKASMVAAPLAAAPERTVSLGVNTLSVRAPKKDWVLSGWDKAKPLRVIFGGKADPRIAALIGNFDALPDGVRFVLQHCDLNPVHLNKSFGTVKFPAPFAETDKFGGSTLRKG